MIKQSQVVRYLDQCTDNDSIDEVLGAYVICKFLNGAKCAQVLTKIHHLVCYLSLTDRGHIVEIGQEAFKSLAIEVSSGAQRVGTRPALTKPGIGIWNVIRSKRSFHQRLHSTITDASGGPGALSSFLSSQRLHAVERSATGSIATPRWAERYHEERLSMITMTNGDEALPSYYSVRGTVLIETSPEAEALRRAEASPAYTMFV